ncbi:Fic family protein [Subsaximicrobium wynnwilliamsii]|uniref:Fic family protein n=1 Tax=Subsaximicrobium wynnwilliamsii TaxID=291179 RepID=A0A5C6ZL81_9FLAO|nr:Fic family protein [Subsaximicrobium wynnwilliamsii]TXD84908.1 Fic family protein [Subsaximicrobium wynnwilliamsii]TXD90579.1 Fic family protein [Subsaximicrobium wynnwilliamsii]TXE05053.1 Fic family protein [Subsaximicrobium wynnwilliamsii]
MWEVDVSYRDTLQTTFNRLFEKANLLKTSRPLPQIALQKLKEALSIEWTYNSNSIEGNSLTLRETQLVLQEGITIKGVSLREHFEAKNHETAIDLLYNLLQPNYVLNSKDILALHALVLRSIEDDHAGRLRNGGVRISGANFIPPNASKVSQLLDDLVQFVVENPLGLNVIELASVFHHKFVYIHPFFDGNGRTVRLAMNLILMAQGFPPAIILTNDRQKYYKALNQANTGNYEKLMLLMCQALERTLNIYVSALPDSDLEYQPISSVVEDPSVPYGQEYVSLLARQGKIDAHKEGRNWYTTKAAVIAYMKAK